MLVQSLHSLANSGFEMASAAENTKVVSNHLYFQSYHRLRDEYVMITPHKNKDRSVADYTGAEQFDADEDTYVSDFAHFLIEKMKEATIIEVHCTGDFLIDEVREIINTEYPPEEDEDSYWYYFERDNIDYCNWCRRFKDGKIMRLYH